MQDEAESVARAIAFFEGCDDAALLRDVLRLIQPKAAAAARRFSNREPPAPASVPPATVPASPEDALRTVRSVRDFGLLQALARAAGKRLEELR